MRLERTMKRTLLSSLILGPALLLAALLVPATAAAAGPITSTACADSDGGTNVSGSTVTCNVWAKTGTLSLPGSSVTIWGFADNAGGSPSVPGPVLVADQGDVVTVNLTNNLSQPTSIVFGGQAMVPDQAGVTAGGTKTYTFTAGAPGTYLYEAGLIPGSQYQAAMGLHGVLVVRPAGAPGQAYGDVSTAFTDEALVVLGEIDPALNGSASPWTFDLRSFAPRWFLVNGRAYAGSTTPVIGTTAGNTLLLRYANAGILHHSIGALGLRQQVLAADGSQLSYPRTIVAETIAPGQTADALVSIPATTTTATRYALYDAAMTLNNSSAAGIGGMLAFIEASGTTGVDTSGPLASGLTLTETPAGSGLYTLTATVSDASTGNANVAAAEYKTDAATTAMSASDGTFDSSTEGVTSATGAIDTTGWPAGTHTVYVRGQDALGNWGPFASTSIFVDRTGPTTSGLALVPNPSNGSVSVALTGTASDAATGNSNVTAAEYSIDGGAATAITIGSPAPTVSLAATISAATVNGMSQGSHVIAVRAQDALGYWGTPATIQLIVDKTGPTTSGVTANPNPATGFTGYNSSTPAVRVSASFSDTVSGGSAIAAAEAFIDTVPVGHGTGFPFVATDGQLNSPSETGYADIPLTTIRQLSTGNHTIHVFAKDAAGNWGPEGTVVLTKLGDDIFADSFASGNTSAWSSTSGTVSVTAPASLNGTPAYGLATTLGGTAGRYVADQSPIAEASYHARFYFSPNGALLANNNSGTGTTIFAGLDGAGTPNTIFAVQARRQSAGGGTYQVRLAVLRAGGTTTTNWYTISNAPHSIEIAWQSSTTASASLYTDGTLRQTLTGLNTSAYLLETVRLGPSAGLASGASGTLYFDAFVSKRSSYVGP